MAGDRYIEMLPDITQYDPLSDADPPARLRHVDRNGVDRGEASPIQHRATIRKLCQAPFFGESTAAIEAAVEILQRLRVFNPTTERYLRLTEPDWEYLKRAVNANPGALLDMNPILLPQVLPMLNAIKNASTSPPKSEIKEKETKLESASAPNGASAPEREVAAA